MKSLYSLFICFLFSISTFAQNPGDLDPAFGINGISSQLIPENTQIYSLSVLDDGKIICAGNQEALIDDYMVLSYLFNPDGTLAPFGGGNWFEFSLGYNYERPKSTYVLPDGRILISGIYYNSFPDAFFFVLCLHPDGTVDTSFGVDGVAAQPGLSFNIDNISVFYEFSGEFDIFLCGNNTETGYYPAIIKLDQNGEMDNSFGADGIYTLSSITGSFSDIYAYSLAGSGYLMLSGYNSNEDSFFISKHDPFTGELMDNFGSDGIFSPETPLGEEAEITSIVFHSTLYENTITAFGDYIHSGGDVDIFAIRLDASDGTLDQSFGIDGWSSLRIAGSNENLSDAIRQADGKYYFGGRSDSNEDDDFMIGRILNNGYLDPSFGENGITLTNIEERDLLFSIALSPEEDRLYCCGNSHTSSIDYPSVACYYTGFGVSVPEQSTPSLLLYPNPVDDIAHIHTDAEGIFLLEIYTLNGMLIQSSMKTGQELTINLENLHSGMYFLKVSDNVINQTIKLIKK